MNMRLSNTRSSAWPGQEEFNVSTTGGTTYSGTVGVTFYDYTGSGHAFPPTSVQGATPAGSWYPVPATDIGASAEPSGCIRPGSTPEA
jgi:hypothetical protein